MLLRPCSLRDFGGGLGGFRDDDRVCWNFPGGPVVKTLALSAQEADVRCLVRELIPQHSRTAKTHVERVVSTDVTWRLWGCQRLWLRPGEGTRLKQPPCPPYPWSEGLPGSWRASAGAHQAGCSAEGSQGGELAAGDCRPLVLPSTRR